VVVAVRVAVVVAAVVPVAAAGAVCDIRARDEVPALSGLALAAGLGKAQHPIAERAQRERVAPPVVQRRGQDEPRQKDAPATVRVEVHRDAATDATARGRTPDGIGNAGGETGRCSPLGSPFLPGPDTRPR
jgi:hypothetical protein